MPLPTEFWHSNLRTLVIGEALVKYYYIILARAADVYGNKGWSEVVLSSVRNWAVFGTVTGYQKQ